jgi:predicted ATPase with chaperone activity
MKKLRAAWSITQVEITCSWCFATMMTLSLEEVKYTGQAHLRCVECNGINVLAPDLLFKAANKMPAVDPDNPPGRALAFDSIVGNLALKRALEVALVGRHTLTYVGDPAIAWNSVIAILGPRATQITRCPCGNFKDPEKLCSCSLEDIVAWRETQKYKEALSSDIYVDVLNPKSDEQFAWREPYMDVYRRVKNVHENQTFQRAKIRNPDHQKMQVVLDFLSRSKYYLDMTQQQVQSTGRVSQTIADMEGQEYVTIVHMAEAVGYKAILLPANNI